MPQTKLAVANPQFYGTVVSSVMVTSYFGSWHHYETREIREKEFLQPNGLSDFLYPKDHSPNF